MKPHEVLDLLEEVAAEVGVICPECDTQYPASAITLQGIYTDGDGLFLLAHCSNCAKDFDDGDGDYFVDGPGSEHGWLSDCQLSLAL